MSLAFDIAILGATGIVGEAMLSILEERAFPVGNIYALASERSSGNSVLFKNRPIIVQNAADFDFSKVQIGLFSAGASVSERYAPLAAEQGCVVIDNTSRFRFDDDIPLVVPEVNPQAIAEYRQRQIIANPNCSTIQLVVALKPIYDAVGIERINISTYQSVSGSGKKGIQALSHETLTLLNGEPPGKKTFPHQIAFNVIPQVDKFQDNGYTWEEMKMVLETKKILNDASIQVNPTCVRVPVFFGHSEAVHIETREKITADQARDILRQAPGIIVMEDPNYPTPLVEGSNEDAVYIGRIREDISHPRGLNFWVVADNVRKGAALNAVQIAEILVNEYW